MHACRHLVFSASAAPSLRLLSPVILRHACAPSVARLQPFTLSSAAAAADGAAGAAPGVQDQLKADMKTAMKAKDQVRLDAIRFLQAAIKQREIELRESSQAISDTEIIKVIQKLAKQRQDSIESYRQGGREDLVAKEEQELQLLRTYLPAMLSPQELEAMVDSVVADLGANSVKQMGAVIKGVQAKSAGRADSKAISDLVKARLQR